MFLMRDWPEAILHLDGDAFFASVFQAVYPQIKGKPVIVGKERGIVTACSYEAKRLGVKRGMRIKEVRKKFPSVLIKESDYDLYQLFSSRMFSLIRQFSPLVEEYSMDEAFVDIKGLRRPLKASYQKIGEMIKKEVEEKLGISVSVGISVTKTLAKIASSFKKPSGLTVINGMAIEKFLKEVKVEEVWGVGGETSAYLNKLGIKTALDFVQKDEEFINRYLTKPYFEIYQELRGIKIYQINPYSKDRYSSITRSASFFPATNNFSVLLAKIVTHIEEAFLTIRKLNYQVGKIMIFLKDEDFFYHKIEWSLLPKINYPFFIHEEIKEKLKRIYQKNKQYRATGCVLSELEEKKVIQSSLFDNYLAGKKIKKVYPLIERGKVDFGTVLYDKRMIREKKKKVFSLPVVQLR